MDLKAAKIIITALLIIRNGPPPHLPHPYLYHYLEIELCVSVCAQYGPPQQLLLAALTANATQQTAKGLLCHTKPPT